MVGRILFVLVFLCGMAAKAQDAAPADDPIAALTAAAREYKAVATAFTPRTSGSERRELDDRARAVNDAAGKAVASLNDQMVLIDARIAQLGPVPTGVAEAPDIRIQRGQLARSRATLDSAIKRGKLLGVEADQLAQEIEESAADAFNERISAHTPSPLTLTFWRDFADGLPRDLHRVGRFVEKEADAIGAAFARNRIGPAVAGFVVAILLLLPLRIAAARFGRAFMIERAPGSRLRRSGLALWIAVSGTLAPGLAAIAFVSGLQNAGMIAPDWSRISNALVRIAFVAGAITALGEALLQPKLASWRLPAIGDEAAIALRRWVRVASGFVLVVGLATAFTASAAGNGGPLTLAADAVSVILNLSLAAAILRTIGSLRRKAGHPSDKAAGDTPPRLASAGIGIVALFAWTAMAVALLAIAAGYFSLALSIAQMLLWWPLVVAALYLLLVAADDLCTGFISRESRMGRTLVQGFGIRGSLIDQAGVFVSAGLRIMLVALAFTLAMGPFGSNATSLLDIAARASQGLTVGEITVSPGAILRALVVLAVGLAVVRVIQRWLIDRYLPATELDAGARNSIAMVARYTGLILAMLWALASLGIGLERIALLLSALSVGIGFGLQAITQNFVSGLILLAERPVKIGDWVRIGTDEGDIKRISVRATEIQIADKSTLIVPNSELITKAVLNKTLSDPLGRIQLQFSLPLGADVARARDMLLAIYAETPAVLDEPKPTVFIDGIVDGRINLNSFAHVNGPRDVYSTRSAILFRLLTDLPAAGIELGSSPQQMQILSGSLPPEPPRDA
ncbi:DUF3772 domain-containing protein [Sphingomonas sp. AP4-R1]|uniref:DUF3772 domain-containing protein n=1 Tax=Sphingomonas sp. AP4-R1 TaxID=2735134 RepID=UPI00149385F0|nr:DUF3772 domain-containing protein [Sphingomonas sp. AP4-R1]QJU59040.1 DUF3772 domain-containing protein [Sphingomonas sp. AP4-R1]